MTYCQGIDLQEAFDAPLSLGRIYTCSWFVLQLYDNGIRCHQCPFKNTAQVSHLPYINGTSFTLPQQMRNMRRSSENTPRNIPGWNTTSDDYLQHISRMVKTLSVNPDVPQYPSVSRAFKNEPVFNEVRNGAPLGQYQNNLPHQKVEAVSEQDNKKNEARGGSAEVEADEQKQGKFQLSKWKTFK